MKRFLLMPLLLLATPALAKDVLVVVLDQSGFKSLHKQVIPSEECRKLLANLRQNIHEGKLPVTLTLQEPVATGRVVSANCVLPDGSIETVDLPAE
jgi:hypothetical protein